MHDLLDSDDYYQCKLVSDALLLDPDNQAFMKEHNIGALQKMAERRLEAMQRGLWQQPRVSGSWKKLSLTYTPQTTGNSSSRALSSNARNGKARWEKLTFGSDSTSSPSSSALSCC